MDKDEYLAAQREIEKEKQAAGRGACVTVIACLVGFVLLFIVGFAILNAVVN